jgi:hypothetical protein
MLPTTCPYAPDHMPLCSRPHYYQDIAAVQRKLATAFESLSTLIQVDVENRFTDKEDGEFKISELIRVIDNNLAIKKQAASASSAHMDD